MAEAGIIGLLFAFCIWSAIKVKVLEEIRVELRKMNCDKHETTDS